MVFTVSIIAGSTYIYSSGNHFSKSTFANLGNNSYRYYVNPFNNSTSTAFVVIFSLNHYSGGPVSFTPFIQVNSSISNLSQVNNIWNLTTATHNDSLSSPYWSEFYLNVLISPDTNNPSYSNFNYFQQQTGSTDIGNDVILWSQSSRDNQSVYMSPINIAPGNYNVSVMVKFQAHQPSQTYLNLTNGSALVLFEEPYWVTSRSISDWFVQRSLHGNELSKWSKKGSV